MHKKLGIILTAGLSLLLTGCSKVSLSTTAKNGFYADLYNSQFEGNIQMD